MTYISKTKPDSTPYEVWFKDSAIFGQEGFASGLTGFGGKIDKFGHAEFDSLTLRRFLEVPELRYNRVEIQLGDKWNAPGAGVIESVEELDQYTGLITLKLEEGEYGAVSVGDLCMGIFHSERTQENAEQDEDDGKGNRKFAGFYTVYFEVTNILDSQNKKFGYRLRPVDEYWNMTFHPCAQMNFVAYGNKTNVDRQTSCYSTRTYTRYLVKQNTWDHKAKNIAMQFGDLSNLNIFGYEMTGYSAYLNSVYFTGTITQVKPNGDEVRVANDCGAWEPDTHYDYYDRVSVEGYLWLCINPNGADDKPSSSSPNWLEQVSKGDKGEVSYFHIKYSPVENPTASQMTETPDVYIGTYVDFNYADSNNPADYTWARFQGVQGEKGEQGIPGIGIDGKTYYLHIKYSNDGGRTFTGNNGEDPGDWLGLLTDLNVNDSTNPADYKWSKTKGEQGDQGIPGSNGSDGADGLIIRRSEWKPNREYRNDQDVPQSVSKIRYLDIVLVRDFGAATGYKVYKCIYTVAPHISSDSNAPGTSGGAAYWEEFTTNVESIYTDLIIAKDAKLDFVSGNAVRVGYESGTNNFTVVAGITGAGGNNGSAIRIWAGATEENRGNAPFRVTQDGKLYARDAYIEGTVHATSGSFTGTIYATDGEFNGTISSNKEGTRILISSQDRSMSMIRDNTTVFEIKSDYIGTGAKLNIKSNNSATTLSMNNGSIVIVDGTDNRANRTYIDDNSILLKDRTYNNQLNLTTSEIVFIDSDYKRYEGYTGEVRALRRIGVNTKDIYLRFRGGILYQVDL